MNLHYYEKRPEEMDNYLAYNGWHFNKKMCDFAISQLSKNNQNFTPIDKQHADIILANAGITLDNNKLYDYVYVANMCNADFMRSSIKDDIHMALYIKDVIDDKDGYDGIVFTRWYADMCAKGNPIDWEEMI